MSYVVHPRAYFAHFRAYYPKSSPLVVEANYLILSVLQDYLVEKVLPDNPISYCISTT